MSLLDVSASLFGGHGIHYVYTLAYPDGRVFYIGKGLYRIDGNHIRYDRINRQEIDARRGKGRNPYKIHVIRKIWREGGELVKTRLAFFETHEEAALYESSLIFLMPGLTNMTAGGEGHSFPVTVEARKKWSAAQRGKKRKPLSTEHKRKISQSNRGVKLSIEQKRKISEGHKGRKVAAKTRE